MTLVAPERPNGWSIFLIFLRLGLTSFGGPIAHLGFFRAEFVVRRRWLSDASYADLVALCQFLPGPASSQVGMAVGLYRGGYLGALAAWVGFTLPSALVLIMVALGIANYGEVIPAAALHGLKVVAVAVVAQAVWGMAQRLCPDILRVTIMTLGAVAVLLMPNAWSQIGVIALAGLIGLAAIAPPSVRQHDRLPLAVSRRAGAAWLFLFLGALFVIPLIPGHTAAVVAAFYRVGSMVFGGGHVVLPLLQAEVVAPGWVAEEFFVAGYGAAQAVPGPLFTFAAFLGSSMKAAPSGWLGGIICLVAIFAPSFFLVVGALPFWEDLRRNGRMQSALAGVNAGVVGLLLAALCDPVWTSAIQHWSDFGLALLAFSALVFGKLPPWLVVIGTALIGWLISLPGWGAGS